MEHLPAGLPAEGMVGRLQRTGPKATRVNLSLKFLVSSAEWEAPTELVLKRAIGLICAGLFYPFR